MEQLQKRKPMSYVTWMMDDHLVRWQDDDWRYPPGFEQRMADHLQNAKSVFVISPAMQDFYLDRFQVKSTVLCGPATPADKPVDRPVGKTLRLAYFGSLGRWQNDAIELLVPQLVSGRVSLDVFSHNPNAITSSLSNAGARLCNGVPATEVPGLCRTYDAVVLPISFENELKNMSYFNIATKFSECLGSGVPTLIIGPRDAIMVKIASKESAAIIVDRCSAESMNNAIDQLFDPLERSRFARQSLNLVRHEYSYDVMRSRWNDNAGATLRNVQHV